VIKIDKGIPAPSAAGPGVTHRPFATMAVGESFRIEAADAHRTRVAASKYARRHGKRFTVRKDGDGYRVWRTE